MYFIPGKRGSGKTSQIILLSSITGMPIVTNCEESVQYIKNLAKENGFAVPDVYTERQVIEGKLRGIDYRGVFIDNAEKIIENALISYLGVDVKAATITV